MMIKTLTDVPSIAKYLQRIGAEPRSMRTAVVKEQRGQYWSDVAVIRFSNDGTVDAPPAYVPTESEVALITAEMKQYEWPTHRKLGRGYQLPPELQAIDRGDIFEFWDREGNLIMLQQRRVKKGDKYYVPWTYWSDNQWRCAEPEGKLPLWGLDELGDHTTVFIHEGAKAARFVRDLVNPKTQEERNRLAEHPWGQELSGAAHLGWIGGALSPARTDWTELSRAGVKRAYIVADNDAPGRAAVPSISFQLKGMTVFVIEFTEQWPASFDLADDFPKSMFGRIGKHRHYIGPTFRAVMHPGTWATDQIPNPTGKGKPIVVLRSEFRDLWSWVEEQDVYICREMPEIMRSAQLFNGMVAPFSHASNTAALLQKAYQGRKTRLCYRPDIPARIVSDTTTSAVNLHTPSDIRPGPGDLQPWIEFLEYLFIVPEERYQVMRWCATLIARPEIRMLYALLLVSERQGMGKSTLGEKILAPLVGLHNTGFPGEKDIVESSFNGWIANKRLIVVGEIYTGQSFKAYNQLKGYITDKSINVNEKFQRPYTIENWTHLLACSNSRKALRMEETDRRWFYPLLSNAPWPREKWGEFNEWLSSGGLAVIRRWADEWTDYVSTGEHSPMTGTKAQMIKESMSEAAQDWIDVLEAMESLDDSVALAMRDVRDWLERRHKRVFESMLDLRKIAEARGWIAQEGRLQVKGSMQNIIVNGRLADTLATSSSEEGKSSLRASLKLMQDWADSQM
jgi:hypothetical protein